MAGGMTSYFSLLYQGILLYIFFVILIMIFCTACNARSVVYGLGRHHLPHSSAGE